MIKDHKYFPFKGCSCHACKHGKHTKGGRHMRRNTERKYRHKTKLLIQHERFDEVDRFISQPYTD